MTPSNQASIFCTRSLHMANMLMFALIPWLANAVASPHSSRGLLDGHPEVTLDYGTFRGTTKYAGVDSFLGMPFAKAGRLENPILISASDKLTGVQDATNYGPACPQQELVASPLNEQNAALGALLSAVEQVAFAPISHQSENCLSINVQAPPGINSTAGLPVMLWIFGGGFELGSSAALGSEATAVEGVIYQGAQIVKRSIEMGQPIVFASANYRLNAFGTLASQEITDAGVSNLCLKDQRTAMEWLQNYIEEFGGDKTKVTLFGESAGSMSIATQLVLNNGDPEGLFRAAIMASGGIAKFKDYHHVQGTFDFIAEKAGCGASTQKIACLRQASYDKIYNAVQQIPNFFSYTSTSVPWYPRPDGKYLVDSPHRLLREGKVARVPYIIGDMKDEGTIFSVVPQINITTNKDFTSFWKQIFFQDLSDEQIEAFTSLYSQDPAEGSPFGTGDLYAIGPQYKRLAAAVGDYTFQDGRRDLLNYTYNTQTAYTYLIEQSDYIIGQIGAFGSLTDLPVLGSFHVSDVVLNDFARIPASISKNTLNIMSTFIAFVNSLDPNDHGLKDLPHWPTWDPSTKAMFEYKESGPTIITDDYREEQMAFINEHADTYMY